MFFSETLNISTKQTVNEPESNACYICYSCSNWFNMDANYVRGSKCLAFPICHQEGMYELHEDCPW